MKPWAAVILVALLLTAGCKEVNIVSVRETSDYDLVPQWYRVEISRCDTLVEYHGQLLATVWNLRDRWATGVAYLLLSYSWNDCQARRGTTYWADWGLAGPDRSDERFLKIAIPYNRIPPRNLDYNGIDNPDINGLIQFVIDVPEIKHHPTRATHFVRLNVQIIWEDEKKLSKEIMIQ